ncbi:Cupredoxin [Terfezia claveryi]|nr:Cupredoxin [Terfezia claveryi]
MLFSKVAIFTTLAGLVSAQSTKVHVVKVGDKDAKLIFTPDSLDAALGDSVQFQFYPTSHSVVRSNFENPCVPLDPSTSNGTSGFYSGIMPVEKSDTYMPTFTILVNETTPIWYYCGVPRHCQLGMVGVINPPKNSDKTLAKYKIDPDGPTGPKPPTTVGNPGDPGNTTTPPGNTTYPPGGNTTGTGTPTSTQGPTDITSAASSFFATAASVVLGAVAVAAFLI